MFRPIVGAGHDIFCFAVILENGWLNIIIITLYQLDQPASIAGEMVAIDGKTFRRSFDRAADKGALHMISAWASANLVVNSRWVSPTKNSHLLGLLALDGATDRRHGMKSGHCTCCDA